ncbi:MAG: M23 family metallopeptidase [Pseudomonadota bacterium]
MPSSEKNKINKFLARIFFVLVLINSCLFALEVKPEKMDVKQGGVYKFIVSLDDKDEFKSAKYNGRELAYFNQSNKEFIVILGINLIDKPGSATVEIESMNSSKSLLLNIIEGKYPRRDMTLAKKHSVFTEEQIEIINTDSAIMQSIFNKHNSKRHFEGSFLKPVPGVINCPFGENRYINGEKRSPHSGIDLKGKTGTKVKATNNGTVVLAGTHFLSGNSIIIDHGMSIYSMYFHLSKIKVSIGDYVKKGQIIGLVGSTGRSTGSHLHYGIRANYAKIDPKMLWEMEIKK